ncbi:hypothetical protein BGZ76_002263 [Entomortierella beljakovae]|nr:hypothetical protein BGZ76_002263 [Entomortierella beljakovae]
MSASTSSTSSTTKLLNPITFDNLDNILEQSPRLKHFEWALGRKTEVTIIPPFIAQRLMKLKQLRFLTLSGWELPWEELILFLRSNSSLTRLRLSSIRRNLVRQSEEDPTIIDSDNNPFPRMDIGLNPQSSLMQNPSSCLSVTDLMLNIERSSNDALMDLSTKTIDTGETLATRFYNHLGLVQV